MAQKILLQQGVHLGETVKANSDDEWLTIELTVQFENEIQLLLEFDPESKEGTAFLESLIGDIDLTDANQLFNRKAWFFVELVTVKAGRGRFGLNAIIDTAGAYYERTPVAATRG